MKVFALPPGENWICDRFVDEWNSEVACATTDINEATVIWLLADWCWQRVPVNLLRQKTVVVSVHHLVPEKFGPEQKREFVIRDQLVDAYHVPCPKTEAQIRCMTSKPIFVKPFWVNSAMWKEESPDLRTTLGINPHTILVGSFQRDTEGSDLVTPKMEKGPDRFCDAVEVLAESYKSDPHMNVEVLLGGWRRQYVMKRLDQAGIKYHYLQMPDFATLNKMYNALDLYIVGARYEGGPQAILECAAAQVQIISTDVGIATEILPAQCIWSDASKVPEIFRAIGNEELRYAYSKVSDLFIPQGFEPFVEFLEKQ